MLVRDLMMDVRSHIIEHDVRNAACASDAEVAEFYLEQLLRQGVSSKIEPDTTTL